MRVLCLLLASILTVVTGQAPGDEQELCTVSLPGAGQNIVVDPTNGKILMDSSHYARLLPLNSGAVWQRMDLDTNNPEGLLSSVSYSQFCNTYFYNFTFLSGKKMEMSVRQQ